MREVKYLIYKKIGEKMPDRVSPGKERIVPLLSFKIPIYICFSIATTEKIADNIRTDIANLDKDFTTVCRDILAKDLKTDDFNFYFADSINLAKEKVYKALEINMKKSFGQDYMIKRLSEFINKHKKELKYER